MSHNTTKLRFTLEIPEGYAFDGYTFDRWCDYLDAIMSRIYAGDGLKFRGESQEAGDSHWTLYETEESVSIEGDGEFEVHFEGETLVKTPVVPFPKAPFDGDYIR